MEFEDKTLKKCSSRYILKVFQRSTCETHVIHIIFKDNQAVPKHGTAWPLGPTGPPHD